MLNTSSTTHTASSPSSRTRACPHTEHSEEETRFHRRLLSSGARLSFRRSRASRQLPGSHFRRPQVSRRVVLAPAHTSRRSKVCCQTRKQGRCISLPNSHTFLFLKSKCYHFLFRGSKQNEHPHINLNDEAGCAPPPCKAKSSQVELRQDESPKDHFFSSGSGQRALSQKPRRR